VPLAQPGWPRARVGYRQHAAARAGGRLAHERENEKNEHDEKQSEHERKTLFRWPARRHIDARRREK
jgi:hypothetical protein